MKKFNNLPQTLILGLVATAALTIAPAQAQTFDGAQTVLLNCPSDLRYPQKCDPNADVVLPLSETGEPGGLQGTVNFVPLGDPGGFILTGTDGTDSNINIDFEPPAGQGYGEMFTVNAGVGSDFHAYMGWGGTIKDLTRNGGNGVPFPAPGGRIKNFIVVDQEVGSGNGIVNGYQTGGFAADLVMVDDIQIKPITSVTSALSFDWEMQVYKLTPDGQRIEEQNPILPPVTDGVTTTYQTTVFANKFAGGLSSTFPFSATELTSRLSSGTPLDGFGYDITMESTPNPRTIIAQVVVPEPTTILSSLLLFGGGAFQLKNRKRS